jgi:hypothetical protein
MRAAADSVIFLDASDFSGKFPQNSQKNQSYAI